jgi:hypothetical protein
VRDGFVANAASEEIGAKRDVLTVGIPHGEPRFWEHRYVPQQTECLQDMLRRVRPLVGAWVRAKRKELAKGE